MKPDIKTFEKAVITYRGNLSKVAKAFDVRRNTVGNWLREDEEFKVIVRDARMRLFDDCLDSANVISQGIAKRDEDGRFVSWIEKPDGNMIRYLLSTLGKEEGFGESLDVTTNGKDLVPQKVNINVVYNKKEDLELQNKETEVL